MASPRRPDPSDDSYACGVMPEPPTAFVVWLIVGTALVSALAVVATPAFLALEAVCRWADKPAERR